jgi:hypothetical protein
VNGTFFAPKTIDILIYIVVSYIDSIEMWHLLPNAVKRPVIVFVSGHENEGRIRRNVRWGGGHNLSRICSMARN